MGRRKSPLTLLVEDAVASIPDHRRFKLDDVVSQLAQTVPLGLIPPSQRARAASYLKDQVRRVASVKVNGRRIWVAIPDKETGEKWWRLLRACDQEDSQALLNYRRNQIDGLRVSYKEMAKVLAMQISEAKQGRVLTYGEALVLLDS